MSKGIKPSNLGAAIEQELTIYAEGVSDRVADAGRRSMQKLVKLTKASAPKGKRRSHYASRITFTEQDMKRGQKRFIWHVKAPDYRLTHLLVKGHATKDGGRTKANPFLQNALDQVLPEYEKEVEEAVKSD